MIIPFYGIKQTLVVDARYKGNVEARVFTLFGGLHGFTKKTFKKFTNNIKEI